jgi:6-pyruvoyltetrahydropterin/6-carboxytetrahydropterin synthase
MFEISVRSHFSAAHHLRGYRGKCEAAHGHNWEVEAFVRGKKTDKIGILVDFRLVKDLLKDVLAKMDHTDLNAKRPFLKTNPTSENIARLIYKELAARLNCAQYKLHRILVRETPETGSSYWED